MTKIRSPSLDIPANYCIFDLNFCMWEYGIPCALEINSIGGLKLDLQPLKTYLHYHNALPKQNHYISMPVATKLGRMITYLDRLLAIKSHDLLITWSCEITWQTNHFISTTTVPKATKLFRMVIHLERLWNIKSYKALIMWSCKVTWETKTHISLLQECGWQPNLAGT